MVIEHWMIFGTFAQQRYFIYPTKDTYKGVIFNANMVSHAPDGLAGFLLEKTDNLTYIIDPLTHAFQHDPSAVMKNRTEVKSSIQGLAEAYGEPILSIVGKRPLLPADLNDNSILEEFVKNCLDFEKEKLSIAMKGSDSLKYFIDLPSEALKPYALVCPYFYMTETSIDRWIDLNINSIELSAKYKDSCKLFAEIVVSQGIILSDRRCNQIIDSYTKMDVDGFIIWIDDLDEHKAGGAELEGLLKLVRGLRNNEKYEVINLHGGYFSILTAGILGESALTGVAHGPEFGEHRPVVPVGGGIPTARYYLPKLHDRIKYRDTVRILSEKGWLNDASTFHDNVCNCSECRNTIGGNISNFTLFGGATAKVVKRGAGIVTMEFPTTETKERCLKHYLQRKKIEYHFSATASEAQLFQDLQDGIDQYENVVGLEGVSHLELWKDIFQQ